MNCTKAEMIDFLMQNCKKKDGSKLMRYELEELTKSKLEQIIIDLGCSARFEDIKVED